MQHHTEPALPDHFPTETTGLPASRRPEIVELPDGAALDLEISPVAKRLGEATVRMLSYNGSIPGPTLKVAQGSEVEVNVINQGDLDATVHWHGLRLENRYDGTHETQAPIPVGASFPSRVTFPDPACTGITRTSARTTARRWASTATSWSFPRTPITGRPPIARLC
jgi:FtsP/CotA-like multicopper oxidase with cupredoxin domain